MKRLLLLFLILSCTTKKKASKNENDINGPMGTIRNNINYIVEYQIKMGYYMPSILNPPATDLEIKETEKKLGMEFNTELKELFTTINGVKNDEKTPSGLMGIMPIEVLLDLNGVVNYNSGMDWEEYIKMYEIKYELGNKLLPFIHDGAGNCYWVDLNEGTKNYGRLFWTNTFGQDPDYLFDSLSEFFEAIKRGYEQGIFTLDEDGYLDCDYQKWGEICHELNPSIKYWREYAK